MGCLDIQSGPREFRETNRVRASRRVSSPGGSHPFRRRSGGESIPLELDPAPAHEPRSTEGKSEDKTRTARREVRLRQRNPNPHSTRPGPGESKSNHAKLN